MEGRRPAPTGRPGGFCPDPFPLPSYSAKDHSLSTSEAGSEGSQPQSSLQAERSSPETLNSTKEP